MSRVAPFIVMLCFATTGCELCAGLASECRVAPHAAITGQILDENTGQGVRGTIIDLVKTGGAAVLQDSSRTMTDANGLFSFDVEATEGGEILATIVVRPPNRPAYRAPGVRIPVTDRGGEARVLVPWSTAPSFPDFAEVVRQGSNERMPFVDIEFRRTGGIELHAPADGVFRARTDASGFFLFFGGAMKPVDAGVLVGDLTIFLPDPPGPTTHVGYRVTATPEFRPPARLHSFGAGPSSPLRSP